MCLSINLYHLNYIKSLTLLLLAGNRMYTKPLGMISKKIYFRNHCYADNTQEGGKMDEVFE